MAQDIRIQGNDCVEYVLPKLKDCPFCGGKAEFTVEGGGEWGDSLSVMCTVCHCSSTRYRIPTYSSTDPEVIDAKFVAAKVWNRRKGGQGGLHENRMGDF